MNGIGRPRLSRSAVRKSLGTSIIRRPSFASSHRLQSVGTESRHFLSRVLPHNRGALRVLQQCAESGMQRTRPFTERAPAIGVGLPIEHWLEFLIDNGQEVEIPEDNRSAFTGLEDVEGHEIVLAVVAGFLLDLGAYCLLGRQRAVDRPAPGTPGSWLLNRV